MIGPSFNPRCPQCGRRHDRFQFDRCRERAEEDEQAAEFMTTPGRVIGPRERTTGTAPGC